MSSKRLFMISLAALVLIAIGVVFFFSRYHYVEKVIWYGYQGKAKFDPYYLTEQFLQRKGYHITRQRNYATLDKKTLNQQYDTLFLSNSGHTLSPAQITVVLDWVKNGGSLLVAAGEKNYSNDDADNDIEHMPTQADINANPALLSRTDEGSPLLTQAGVAAVYCHADDCICPQKTDTHLKDEENDMLDEIFGDYLDTKPNDEPHTIAEKADQLLNVEPHRRDTRIKLDGQTLLHSHHRASILYALPGHDTQRLYQQSAYCYGDLFAVFAHGQGRIVVYDNSPMDFSSTKRWWEQPPLFTHHHATYLDALLQVSAPHGGKRILWYESAVYPSIWAFTWRYGAFAVVAAVLLLLAWVWQNSRRFGPLLVEDKRRSLSMQRHLLASGRFYYQQEQQNTLIANTYEQLERAIARRIPAPTRLSKTALIEKLAEKTALPANDIAEVMARRYPQTDADFTRLMYLINLIQQRLSSNPTERNNDGKSY